MSDVEALKLFDGSRLEAIKKLIGMIKQIDPDKLNGFVTWLTDLLGSLFGASDVSAMALDADEDAAVAEAFADGQFQAQSLNLAAIIALVKLIISIWQSLRPKPEMPKGNDSSRIQHL